MWLPGALPEPSVMGTSGSPEVSVVLPCLDEEQSVGVCIEQAMSALKRADLSGEVIVVDNGSTDRSSRIALDQGAQVLVESREGYGSALRSGIAAAAGDVVVMADADGTYDLARTAELVNPILDDEADLVIAARQVGAARDMPLLNRFFGTPFLTFLINRATGGPIVKDSQSGFRAFRKSAAQSLELRATGMEFASEMLILAARAGWRIREVPMHYGARLGKSKLHALADGWRHLRLIALLAPDLLLVWPGAAAIAAGLGLAIWSLVYPHGIQVGSVLWQPVFFSTIAIVLGVHTLLAGFVVAYVSSVSPDRTKRTFSFVGDERFLSWCGRGGLSAAAAGLLLDIVLFGLWMSDHSPKDKALPLAALAQGLLISGTTVWLFALITKLLVTRARTQGATPRGLAALVAGGHSPMAPTSRGADDA
jgi:glycosyltransferase involved in cell wall biosynthesis